MIYCVYQGRPCVWLEESEDDYRCRLYKKILDSVLHRSVMGNFICILPCDKCKKAKYRKREFRGVK